MTSDFDRYPPPIFVDGLPFINEEGLIDERTTAGYSPDNIPDRIIAPKEISKGIPKL